MNKEQLENMFDENFRMWSNWELIYDWQLDEWTEYDYVKQFIFETIIPELLKSVMPEFDNLESINKYGEKSLDYLNAWSNWEAKYMQKLKQKAKELYWIDL